MGLPLRLGLETLGGSFPLALGGKAPLPPHLAAAPLGDLISQGLATPQGSYK